jgi:hypothetical protein
MSVPAISDDATLEHLCDVVREYLAEEAMYGCMVERKIGN